MVSWTEKLCGHEIVIRVLGKDGTTEATPEEENAPRRLIGTIRFGEKERTYEKVKSDTSTENIHGNQSPVQS